FISSFRGLQPCSSPDIPGSIGLQANHIALRLHNPALEPGSPARPVLARWGGEARNELAQQPFSMPPRLQSSVFQNHRSRSSSSTELSVFSSRYFTMTGV